MITKYNDTSLIDKDPVSEQVSTSKQSQEVKEIPYLGRFGQVIKELAQENDFKYLVDEATNYSKTTKRELVLRFAAFYFNGYQAYYAPSISFLADTMEKYQDISPRHEVELRADFRNSIHIIRSLFGKNAFKRFMPGNDQNKNGQWDTNKFQISLYDILMYSFARISVYKVLQHKDRIDEALINLMSNDQEFIDTMETSTSSRIFVKARFEKWMNILEQILNKGTNHPGTFNYSLKFELFTSHNNCALCGEPIQIFDDSTLYNMENYWIGDKIIPANAQLTHRYCKAAKSRSTGN